MAAAQNNTIAKYNIGVNYEIGEGVEKDYQQAYNWFLSAANDGYPIAQYAMGRLYENGIGTKMDDERAYNWFLLAANNNDKHAQYCIGFFYHYGHFVNRDFVEAHKWYTLATTDNISDLEITNYQLGILYENGHGVDQNSDMAYKYYSLAANANHKKARDKLHGLSVLKIRIKLEIVLYTYVDHHEGISYLFFCNLIGHLNKKLGINNFDDSLIASWITKYLTKYFKTMESDFDSSIIQIWFKDLYGSD